jgi:hypothetical protein
MQNLITFAAILVAASPYAHSPDVEALTRGAAEAVEIDPEPPIMGTKRGDVALILVFEMAESSMRLTKNGECIAGDFWNGVPHAYGPLQLQNAPQEFACAAAEAAKLWLMRAHDSVKRCHSLEPDDRLAVITSGNCSRGHVKSRSRMRAARAALAKMEATNE